MEKSPAAGTFCGLKYNVMVTYMYAESTIAEESWHSLLTRHFQSLGDSAAEWLGTKHETKRSRV